MLEKLKNIMSKNKNEEISTEENKDGKEVKDKPKKAKKLSKSAQMEQDLEESRIEIAEQKDKFLRLFAEFDNFKKRNVKERLELMRTAAQDTMQALLPVLDDFDRAKQAAEDENSTEPFSEGVMLVYQKLHNTLKQRGLEEMVSTGEVFDPEFHQSITEIPASSDDMKGKVMDTIEKGYLLKEKIIRHAKVVVGK